MKARIPALFAVAATASLILAGCSSASSGGMSGHDMSNMDTSTMSAATTPAAASDTNFNNQDVTFSQGMAMHHMQAIQMSDTLLGKSGIDARVTALATKIKQAQDPEITEMNGWLTSWGKATVDSSSASMGSMGGSEMMSPADMKKLDQASGKSASTLFLKQMTVHHTSAITMAKQEVADGRNPKAVALAKKIISDQSAQITQMKKLLQKL